MAKYSFNIKDASGLYKKLLDDYQDFCADPTSSRVALNCAMTAWHLCDWVFYEFIVISSPKIKLTSFQSDMKIKCPSLKIMQHITNGSKHHTLTQGVPFIDNTNLHAGTFDSSFANSFDTSSLEINLVDGTTVYFEDVLKNVVDFWTLYVQTATGIKL